MSHASVALVAAIVAAAALPQARPARRMSNDARARPTGSLIATTGSPQLIESGGAATTLLMNERDYQAFVDLHGQQDPSFVPIRRKPEGLSPRAQYGFNLILGGHNLCWAIDGGPEDGYTFYGDWNGNGDLTDDAPMRFEKVNGAFSLHVERQERDGGVTYPVAMTLVLDSATPPGKTQAQPVLRTYNRSTRSGELTMPDGRHVAFRLTGSAGFYAEAFHTVGFDLNGDGTFDAETEVFRVSEKYVNVGDTSYAFAVDPHGRSLTLTALTEHLAPRAALTDGSPAPDFAFTDLDGAPRKLSDYRGKVVLLDFWGVWCGPCVAEVPRLVALYERYHDRGLEIIGLDTIDTRDKVLAFIDAHKMRWPQTIEPDKGPIQTLYRVHGWPTYYVIASDGTIRKAASGSIDSVVAALLDR